MNLEDVLDPEYGLQQDEWSLTKPTFGEEGQLQVVGWSGRTHRQKQYILRCSVCEEQSELFGGGLFKATKSQIVNNAVIPCGCSNHVRWNATQFKILSTRQAKFLGYEFMGFDGRWKGANTKVKMLCKDHGLWDSCSIYKLMKGIGCPSCGNQRQQQSYINWIIDEHNNAVAIKFGIARDSKRRLKDQGRQSVYTIKQHAVYTFPSVQQCKQAERECKKELECGVVLKRDMPDGWTETTWSYNIGKVVDIYKRNGGVLV